MFHTSGLKGVVQYIFKCIQQKHIPLTNFVVFANVTLLYSEEENEWTGASAVYFGDNVSPNYWWQSADPSILSSFKLQIQNTSSNRVHSLTLVKYKVMTVIELFFLSLMIQNVLYCIGIYIVYFYINI
jgi:hypothetical protein